MHFVNWPFREGRNVQTLICEWLSILLPALGNTSSGYAVRRRQDFAFVNLQGKKVTQKIIPAFLHLLAEEKEKHIAYTWDQVSDDQIIVHTGMIHETANDEKILPVSDASEWLSATKEMIVNDNIKFGGMSIGFDFESRDDRDRDQIFKDFQKWSHNSDFYGFLENHPSVPGLRFSPITKRHITPMMIWLNPLE